MKAVVYDKSKAPEVLVLREVEKPIPGDNEVLVRIFAVSLNAADYRSMRMGIIPKRKIFGSDIAGCIEATGKNVIKLAVGDEVFGDLSSCGFGGFAEYVVVPERLLALKPKDVSFEVAAAVPMAAVTALQAVRSKGNIQQGKRVLIYGAGGGVGTFAVQLSKYFGAEVTAVCSENKVQLVKDLGADHVINYNEQDFTKGGKKYDLVLAVNGKNSLTEYKHILTKRGIFVVVGGALSQLIKTMLFGAFMSIGGKKMTFLAAKPNMEDLEFIIKLVQEGKINPVMDRRYSLHETAEAMRYLSEGHARGKVVINVVHSTHAFY
ncbi:NAD(P)-dependent alcohol dehydrogenase [Mobilitalea sibirica]|uniref:NAD(P)-dependent alcohol dehydrogenase n=1 Tax=Mobilitalea sibirica TaxID=1462919 RepID=A0A8J7L2J7_9FIRM|nr:NAD(P)-dependent alcohol dehydrogenase [Mobilitalea sibirica]MBH1940763.1 NAD(P)-dependent alcohol dehydrogenase [Mobilitalea sibirica]